MKTLKITENFKTINKDKKSVITVGTFDGIHLAHKKIISTLVDIAKQKNRQSIVFTFKNHPRSFFSDFMPRLLTTNEQKAEILDKLNVDLLFLQTFDKNFASLSAENFIKDILIDKLNMETLIIGDDHRLGRGREGSYEHLLQLGEKYFFDVIRINSVYIDNQRVSSTNIRKFIIDGELTKANKMLGYNYFFDGIVEKGKKIGSKLGFPTANIRLNPDKLLPAIGVYAVFCIIDGKKFPAMANIGFRPTVAYSKKITLEVHIINFFDDIYGKFLRIEFVEKIRDEMKFDSRNELITQLKKDKQKVSAILSQTV